jgi:hypothetical protein
MRKFTLFCSLVLFLVLVPLATMAALPTTGNIGYLYNAATGKFLSHGVTTVSNSGAKVDDYGVPVEIKNEGNASEFSGYTYLRLQMCDYYGRYLRVVASGLDCAGTSYHKWAAKETENGILLRCIYKPSQVAYATQGYFLAIDEDGKLVLVDGEENAAVWQWKSASEQIAIVDAAENARIAAIGAKGGLTVSSIAQLETELSAMSSTDKTSSITNPTMFTNTDGWTVNNIQGVDINNGSYRIQNGSPTQATVSQQVTGLPSGFYKVEVQAFYRATKLDSCKIFGDEGFRYSNAFVKANNNKVLIKDWYAIATDNYTKPTSRSQIKDEFDEGDKYTHTLYTWVDDAGTLDLSIEVPSLGGQSSSKGNWICFNNVRLTYYFSPEDLGPYVTQLEEAVAAAEALDLPTTQREILDAVVDEYNKAWSTISEYETAISAIEDATTTAQAYVAPYAAYKSLRGNINTSLIGKTSKYTDPSDATSAYNSVLSAQNAAVDGAVTTDAISNAQSTLWSAAAAWMKSVSINPGPGFDLTWMIQNSDFSDIDYKKAWDETLVSGTTAGVTNGVMRYYQSDFDLSQTLPYTLPAGSYTLTMDGFERTNSPMNTAYPDYTGGTSIVTGTFYLNSNENLVMNLFDVQSVTDNSKGGARPTGASFYIPDGSSAAKKYIDAGLYPNTLNAVLGEDAAVTIGYRCANTKAWTCVDNFHLEYNGTPVSATLGSNGYSTFASPYPLDLTNLPDGLTAYKAAVDGSTVTFTELDQAVPAYTGILLKGDESASYDIPVAGAGTIVSDNAFCVNEAGTTFSPESGYNYFGLKKNTLTFGLFDPSAVAIPANKAYLKVSEGAGARLDISFDGEAPTGISAFAETEDGVQQDGKFLEDGQIVIVRNGVKYRANGQIVK